MRFRRLRAAVRRRTRLLVGIMLLIGIVCGHFAGEVYTHLAALWDTSAGSVTLELEADPNLEGLDAPNVGIARPIVKKGEDEALIAWQAETREKLRERLGLERTRTCTAEGDIDYLSQERLDWGGTRILFKYISVDGSEIPGYLHVPDRRPERQLPGVMVIPGHVRERQSGIEQLAFDTASYQKAAAAALARRAKVVTMAIELRGFGYLGAPFSTEHKLVAYNAILAGESYKAVVLRDVKCAIDILVGLEEVDATRLAITGASYGGEIAVYYSALDPRLTAVAFSSFGGGLGFKSRAYGTAANQPHYCHVLPVLDLTLRQEEWMALIAPRALLGVRGTRNSPFTEKVRKKYGLAWKVLGYPGNIELRSDSGGHEYFLDPTVRFLVDRL